MSCLKLIASFVSGSWRTNPLNSNRIGTAYELQQTVAEFADYLRTYRQVQNYADSLMLSMKTALYPALSELTENEIFCNAGKGL